MTHSRGGKLKKENSNSMYVDVQLVSDLKSLIWMIMSLKVRSSMKRKR